MKRIILCLMVLCLLGCGERNPQDYIKSGQTLLHCKSKYNIPSELLFYDNAKIRNVVEDINGVYFVSYYITDVHGKTHSININEIDNYTCEEIK